MYTGKELYVDDKENNITRDITKFTDGMATMNRTKFDIAIAEQKEFSVAEGNNISSSYIKRTKNIISEFLYFMGYSAFETSKMFLEFGYTHPEYDYKFYFNSLLIILWWLVILISLPLCTPLLALLFLIYLGIKYIIKKIVKKEAQK